jgi:hypothetical protein
VHLELLLPTAKERCWRACDGVETTSIPSLFENTQIVVSNDSIHVIYCAPVSSPQCVALGGPSMLSSTCKKKTWPDAIIEMFPPMMVTYSARILASRPIKLFTIYISDSVQSRRRSLPFASSMSSPFRLARAVTFPIKPLSVGSYDARMTKLHHIINLFLIF